MTAAEATAESRPAAPKSFDYFDHDADIGIIGRGATVEQAFEAAAEAMFAIMATVPAGTRGERIEIAFTEADPEFALVAWLNGLLGEARARELLPFSFHLERSGDDWRGSAEGCPWTQARERGVEVKGATLTALAVRSDASGAQARCVVDV